MNFHTASFYASAAISTAPKISSAWLSTDRISCRNQTWTTLRSPTSYQLLAATTPTRRTLAHAATDDPSSSSDILLDTPFFRIYSDRRIDRLDGTDTVPAGLDPATGVTSRDAVIDGDTGVYARLYLPVVPDTPAAETKKLPVLVYFHGGGFVSHSAASPPYHRFLNALAARARVLVVSVSYRLAPEHPLPAGYEDGFRALRWAAAGAADADPWLSRHGDLARGVFLGGDSAGGNVAHNVAMMAAAAGASPAAAPRIEGAVLLQPGFAGKELIDGEQAGPAAVTAALWGVVCPGAADGVDDPRMNPTAKPSLLRELPCERVLVCAGERDFLRPRNRAYYEAVVAASASGWRGAAEWFESPGVGHQFFLQDTGCAEAVELVERLAKFFAAK